MADPVEKAPLRDKTLRKGLKILETLTLNGAMHLRDVASEGNMTRGNAHHILQTLIEEGFVRQEAGTARYANTLKLWEICVRQLEQHDLIGPCRPVMRQLRDQTNETINLAVLDGNDVLYLHKEDSGEAIGSFTQIGGRAPAHCVATGKAMIAFDLEGEAAWRRVNLKSHGNATITNPDDFIAEMKATCERGYSINTGGEWRGNVRACASPVLGWGGQVRAAIGISGPEDRMPAERIADYGALLWEATQSISERPVRVPNAKNNRN